MSRAPEFIRLFNELDNWLRRSNGGDRARSFMERVEDAARRNPSLRRFRDDLREYAELRNAIVHHRGFPESFIAEPTEEALNGLARLTERVLRPPRLIPRFQRELRVFGPDDGLYDALRYMGEQGFSQAVVADGKGPATRLAVLSADGLARWICAMAAQDLISVKEARVRDVLPYEKPGTFAILPQGATIDEARALFEQALEARRPKLRCILITTDGGQATRLLGFLIAADLLDEG